ncbi:MAG: tetratricopeptide repeat protein [Leptolyngbya sp. RL_3_1]|nr:tetratricopeptide repeat protein [Leptolyngbya sp. RL_3_1]
MRPPRSPLRLRSGGGYGLGETRPATTTPEPWDLDPLNEVWPETELSPWATAPPQILAQADRQLSEAAQLFEQGLELLNRSQFRAAIPLFEEALAILQAIGHRPGQGATLGNLGLIYADLGEYERAIDFHEQYLEIAQEIGEQAWEGAALSSLGNAYLSLSQYERAIDLYEQQLAIVREIGDRTGEGAPWVIWVMLTSAWANMSAPSISMNRT